MTGRDCLFLRRLFSWGSTGSGRVNELSSQSYSTWLGEYAIGEMKDYLVSEYLFYLLRYLLLRVVPLYMNFLSAASSSLFLGGSVENSLTIGFFPCNGNWRLGIPLGRGGI